MDFDPRPYIKEIARAAPALAAEATLIARHCRR